MAANSSVVLAKDLSDAIELGHPWVFDRAIASEPKGLAPGSLVSVEYRGRVLATGIYDPKSPLRVRILGLGSVASGDSAWVATAAAEASSMRLSDPSLADVTAARLIHGENDGMPGLVVDLYDDTAVVVFDGAGPSRFWRDRLGDVVAGLERAGHACPRVWMRERGRQGQAHRGGVPDSEIAVREGQSRFYVDVVRGQKTGLFLDQRDNRRRIASLSAGARVLNLFSYTGGFSIAAALAGASRTTSVDIAAPAMAAARRSFELSGLDPSRHELTVSDVFEFCSNAVDHNRRFDVVVCDPPSFAANARSVPQATRAYRKLADACMTLVESPGILLFASCSSHVGDSRLLKVLAAAAAAAGRAIRIRGVHGAASDHPTRPGFPEGRYLSAIFAYLS